MGCGWKTVRGRRVRVGPVGAPVVGTSVMSLNVLNLLSILNIGFVAGSPEFTREDLSTATVRLWLNPESGYLLESRMSPGSPPMYRAISQAEATLWEAQGPTPAMIAHAFVPEEIPYY